MLASDLQVSEHLSIIPYPHLSQQFIPKNNLDQYESSAEF